MMEDIRLVKKELRTAMKARLAAVSPHETLRASESVLAQLESLEQWKRADIVLAFLSMKDEIDTIPILNAAQEQGKTLAVPRVVGPDLVFYQIQDLEKDVAPGAFGILEPVSGLCPVAVETLSEHHIVALVPGLAFDKENFRLGRGKGFYDRFLASAGDSLFKIGIGYSFQLVEKVPREPHDKALDLIITSRS
ncbi:MAG: 5-formyltetrahydrofolate cyclo-ligase [Spirochaetia bacterium]|nr:5-formyltetrahydrofolate cyclo-ligase [Spirochaetia bacterium]